MENLFKEIGMEVPNCTRGKKLAHLSLVYNEKYLCPFMCYINYNETPQDIDDFYDNTPL